MGKRGPKPGGRYKERTKVFSSRLTEPTRSALEDAAKAKGHSLSHEIEHRLRKSFDTDSVVDQLGGWQLHAILRTVAASMTAAGMQAGVDKAGRTGSDAPRDWLNDPYAFDCAVRATSAVLEALRPAGDPSPPPVPKEIGPKDWGASRKIMADMLRDELAHLGEIAASRFLSAIADAEPTQPPPDGSLAPEQKLARKIASDLGPLHVRLEPMKPTRRRRKK